MIAEDMGVNKLTQRKVEGLNHWYLRMDREGRGCTED